MSTPDTRAILQELVNAVHALPIESIICYASTIPEYKPNELAHNVNIAMSAARAALSVPDVNLPPGWKLTPVKPTYEMLKAAERHFKKYGVEGGYMEIWEDMHEAAPNPQEQEK